MVSWDEAKILIRKLHQREETEKYRRPTEAEWECAERAGSQSSWFLGDIEMELGGYSWCYRNSGGITNPAGKKAQIPGGSMMFMEISGIGCKTGIVKLITPHLRHRVLRGLIEAKTESFVVDLGATLRLVAVPRIGTVSLRVAGAAASACAWLSPQLRKEGNKRRRGRGKEWDIGPAERRLAAFLST
jgi:hypothetical protein